MSQTRNILAGFYTMEDAKQAANMLEQNGFSDIQVERVNMYPSSSLNDTTNIITGDFGSLTNLTLGSFTNKDAEVLAATNVNASGMSDGNQNKIKQVYQDVLLTVVTDEENASTAESIINQFGGEA